MTTTSPDPIRVFIGSGEASLLERKTLIYSLKKTTKRPLEICVFNGTHNALEYEGRDPVPAPLPLKIKYRNITEFSNYRFLIPELCGFRGRGIYLDSDMVCLADIGELADAPLDGFDFLAKAEAYGTSQDAAWGLSVILFDCERCRFDLEKIFADMEAGQYSLDDFHRMTPKFLARHRYAIGKIDPRWNEFDRHDANTRLIHYTRLATQPWKFAHHPYGEIWFEHYREAQAAGLVTSEDIRISLARAYVRQDIQQGNSPPGLFGRVARRLTRLVSG